MKLGFMEEWDKTLHDMVLN